MDTVSTSFGQVVVGPPGSGKSTYCRGVCEFLNGIGRKTVIVNLDPANENLPYECAINIDELVTLASAMDEHGLGPNGGIMYCLEYLEANVDWLEAKLRANAGAYFLFDLPGQIELFTHHTSLRHILDKLTFKTTLRLAVVNLVDAHHISDPTKYISLLLVSLSIMLQLEMPQINVLSKIDLVEKYGTLAMGLEYYTHVLDLSYLTGAIANDDTVPPKFKRLNEALSELVEDFALVSFKTLNIQDGPSVAALLREVDRCNGYLYGTLESERLMSVIEKGAVDEFDVERMYMSKGDSGGGEGAH